MPEYEMPIEEQMTILVRKFSAFEGTLATFGERLDKVDARLDKVDARLDRIDGRLDKVDGRLGKVDARLDKIDARLDKIDGRLDEVDGRLGRIEIRLDETHAIAKMGLEAIDALRETTNQKFAGVEKKQREEVELLKTVIVHVRKRVDAVERPRRGRG